MPVFEYTALDKSGKSLNGIIDADSLPVARQKIRANGAYPVEVIAASGQKKSDSKKNSLILSSPFNRVKAEEIYVLTRQLGTLLGAGVPLVSALDALIEQANNSVLKRIIAQIKEDVNEGKSLTSALSNHPRQFSKIYINMVRAGEESGSLDIVLARLADFGEHQQTIRSRFKAAMIYPIIMAIIGVAILFFLVTFVVPEITGIFIEMNQTLPLPTRLLIGSSGFLKSFWWLLILLLAVVIVAVRMFINSPPGRNMWDKFKLILPVFGQINQKIALGRLARTLGSLVENGVPLLMALQIVRNIVNNVHIAEVVDDAIEKIQAGKSMSRSFSSSKWFPPMFVQMVAVGEQSGELEQMLTKVADAYEKDAETSINGMTSLLEPMMILLMGAGVGFVVVSILLPIFEMNKLIK